MTTRAAVSDTRIVCDRRFRLVKDLRCSLVYGLYGVWAVARVAGFWFGLSSRHPIQFTIYVWTSSDCVSCFFLRVVLATLCSKFLEP
jgi:hypothetical protein